MSEAIATQARERRVMRKRSLEIQCALDRIIDAIGDLSVEESLVALHEAMTKQLGKPHRQVYILTDRAA